MIPPNLARNDATARRIRVSHRASSFKALYHAPKATSKWTIVRLEQQLKTKNIACGFYLMCYWFQNLILIFGDL